jgi:hypothetical protein
MLAFDLIIGFALTLILLSAVSWFATSPPAQVARTIKWGLIVVAIVAIGLAVVSGWLAAIWTGFWLLLAFLDRLLGSRILWFLLSAAPLFPRLRRAFRGAAGGGPATGRSSDVETAWLRMTLDHDSGTMDGLVTQGRLRGRRLGELAAADLLQLLAELRVADVDSAALLEGYLDAVHSGWRQAQDSGPAAPPGGSEMTREEAYRVLGLEPGATPEQITAAYRELMKRVHPDQGGSAYLAAKLNQAKALLLSE